MRRPEEEHVSRRSFLRAAAVTAAAATATGAGAALVSSNPRPLTPVPIVDQPVYQNLIAESGDETSELFAQMAALQADNVRLQARLDALQRQLKSERSDDAAADRALSEELSATAEQVSILSGLLSLYDQLDGIDLSEMLEEGIASVSAGISDLFEAVPGLSEGIEVGQQAINELDQHIPLVQTGWLWLKDHLELLQSLYTVIESRLQSAADAAAPLLQLINEWIQDVLKWLPFRLGERAGRILAAITDLLETTPRTISGLDGNVARPLEVWLGDSDDDIPLRKQVVKPLREQLIQTATQTVTRAETMRAVYRTQLEEPARSAVESRKAVRDRIAQYRQRHSL